MTPSDAIFWWGFACGIFAAILLSRGILLYLIGRADLAGVDDEEEYLGQHVTLPKELT